MSDRTVERQLAALNRAGVSTPSEAVRVALAVPPADLVEKAQRWRKPVVWRPKKGTRIGSAIFEGFYAIHALEWHAQRSSGYGGSDVAAIVGCSKWGSPTSLWSERTGRVERRDDGKNAAAKRWGQKLERVVIEEYAHEHPELVVFIWPEGKGASFRSTVWDIALASPDALTYNPETGEWGILEAKTARYDDEWKDPDLAVRIVPVYYLTQVQHYLDVMGFTVYALSALFTGSDYHEFAGQADPFEQRVNRNRVIEFHQLVIDDVPPPLDGHEATLTIVRREHPDILRGESVELGPVGDEWIAARRARIHAEEAESAAAAAVLREMGSVQNGDVRGMRVVAREAKGTGTPYLKAKIK
jgi:hypothetical protein